jgi:hypothetical protein
MFQNRGLPGDTPVQGSAVQDPSQVVLCRTLLLRMDESKQRLPKEHARLLTQVAGEHRVEMEEAEVGGQQRPICGSP